MAAVTHLGVRAVELGDEEARSVERRAELLFAKRGHEPLWERVVDSEGIQDADAWRRIEEFVTGPATMFVRDSEGLCAFRFESGRDLVATIGECSGFVLHVIDDANRFLLSFNDHDFLIGCGAAAEWVRGLRPSS